MLCKGLDVVFFAARYTYIWLLSLAVLSCGGMCASQLHCGVMGFPENFSLLAWELKQYTHLLLSGFCHLHWMFLPRLYIFCVFISMQNSGYVFLKHPIGTFIIVGVLLSTLNVLAKIPYIFCVFIGMQNSVHVLLKHSVSLVSKH